MRAFNFIFFFGIILSSCSKNFLMLDDYYARANGKERKFLKSYHDIDSICIPTIKFRHDSHIGRGTNGNISMNRSETIDFLRASYTRSFDLSLCMSIEDSLPVGNFKTNKKRIENETNSCCDVVIVPDLIITSYTTRNVEGGGGLTFVEDIGNDINFMEYKLTTAIYENDALIYMDNHAYWAEILSERGEQLMYQVPQDVIDSLVTLTLQEYFKRVK